MADPLIRKEHYNRIVEDIDQLPALPAIVSRLMQVVNSPDTSAEDAAGLIERDPALTGKMLRLANSAFYGIPRTISSVSSAVVILGFNTIKSLVLSASVMQIFPGTNGRQLFDRKKFWRHSIVTAIAAKTIVRQYMRVKMMDPESAFCAGILHDIGKLIFEQYLHDEYQQACTYAREQHVPLLDAETQVLGINHAQVGRILADKWALPIELEHTIVSHHEPDPSSDMIDLIAAVHLANFMTHELRITVFDDEASRPEWPQARTMLKIDDDIYGRLFHSVQDELEKSDEFFSIVS
ncbi:MAG: HDOD domain-containing protein [Chitinivibrionales bacterium]|nr:HDOD domain-containing protein [Chitinivibrionales bacterium]